MLAYIARRLLFLIPIMIGLSFIVFAYVRALPGGPAVALLGERASAGATAAIERDLGLDRPLPVQYQHYMATVLSGNLGISIRSRRPVTEELARRFPATVELSVAAMLFAITLGIPLGFVAAKRHQGVVDQASLVGSLIGISFPVLVLALLIKYFFGVKLGWLPTIGRIDPTVRLDHPTNFYVLDAILTRNWSALGNVVRHLILPAMALGTIPLAIITRITRASVLDVVSEDYVRTARAKGLDPGPINRRHILRNATLPVVTVIGLQTGLLLTGAILTETVFSWPGVGSWMLDAIRFRDYAVIQGGIVFFALLIVVVNLLVDISYAFLNPRIRYR
jgi:peptide/nickel transport system permease protein